MIDIDTKYIEEKLRDRYPGFKHRIIVKKAVAMAAYEERRREDNDKSMGRQQ